MATDQFCLRWNNFQVNITSALESLKCDEDLVDVTLTCDGQNVKAHKVILSACSPYFRNLFRENPCQHPVVILKDVSFDDVTALLNFMYQGEVYITQDRLAPFLHTAELLQVRGLAGATSPFKESQPPSVHQPPVHQPKPLQQHQLKPKKPSHVSAGQLKRVTPPLSISSSTVPHATVTKPLSYTPPYRAAKSPLVSPTPKETLPSSISTFPLKEKCAVPNASNEQSSSSSYSALPEQQQYPSVHQQQSSPTYSAEERSCSPQPMTAKRRKAFPRRLSSSQSVEPEPAKEGSAEESDVVKVVPPSVKQEPVDDEDLEGDMHDDMDSSSRHSGDSEDMDVTGFYAQPILESEEPESLESSVVKEEATADGAIDASPPSMLLRSLAGVPLQPSDDVGSKPSSIHHPHRSLWRCMQPRLCPICFKTFSNSFNLKQHVQNVHLPSMTVQCPVCRKGFKNKRYLRKHLVSYHGAPLRRIRTQEGQIIHIRDSN